MLDQETKKRIDDCRNILVGKVPDPKSQVEQITIAMIYKFMYDMDMESIEMGGIATYFVGEYERYSWKNIFNPRIGGNEMITLYGEGIVKMNLNPNIPQLFRDIFKNAYLPYRDPETLKLFLKGINEFHYSHSEKLGDAFEYLLSVLGSQGDAGQFRTPRHIIDFMVELLQPKKTDRILDPACGTSGFLISSYKHILRNNTKNNLGDLITVDERNQMVENISGYDISPDMVRLSLVNLYLHNFSNPKIYEYDSLTSEDRWNEYYDVILANPPFMSPKGGIKPHKRFSIESNRAEVLFVDYIMEHLTPKGRSGIVVPEGIIFQSGIAYKSLRKLLVEKYLVGVISLPSGVFQPYSGVKTSILILDKELSQKTDKIFFGKVDNDGFDLGAQRREIEKNDLPILTKEVTEYLDGLRHGIFVESEKLNYVSKEQILSSKDYNLSSTIYNKTLPSNYSTFPLVKLKNLITIQSGFAFDSSKFNESQGFPLIRIRNIKKGYTDTLYDGQILKDYIVKNGDLLIGMDGEFNCSIWNGSEALLNQRVCRVSSYKNTIRGFIFYNIKQKLKEIESETFAVTVKHISTKQILDIEIPLPPIEVQEEIVRELEQYQRIIDGAKQVVDNYKPIIDIDPSWEMKELGEIGKVTMCKRIFKEQTSNAGDVPFYKIGTFGGLPDAFISLELYNDFISKYSYPKKGDILISTSGTIGKIVEFDGRPSYFQDSNIVWIDNNETIVTNKFLKIFYQCIKWRPTEGVTIARLYNKNIQETIIPIPPLEIQQSIVERIESERQIIEGNKKLIEIYTQKIQDRINKIWGE
uniref:N-6 DNA methylase n=1 Tax=Algoriphagus sp. TaxID=1872435 RepID=UPI004048C8D2